jgi:hypothetical protein
MTTAATITAAAAFAMFVVMAVTTAATVMIVVMTVTTAATVMIVAMIVTMRTVYMTMFQLFCRCFAKRDNFNIELQILASQHVVTINNNVFITHFGDFYRYRPLIGFREETHANLQLIDTHKNVFWNALNQVFVVLPVRIVSANFYVKFVAHFVAIQRIFQTGNQGTVTMQVVQRRAYRRLINQHTVFCTYLIGQADHQVFCYFHDIS